MHRVTYHLVGNEPSSFDYQTFRLLCCVATSNMHSVCKQTTSGIYDKGTIQGVQQHFTCNIVMKFII